MELPRDTMAPPAYADDASPSQDRGRKLMNRFQEDDLQSEFQRLEVSRPRDQPRDYAPYPDSGSRRSSGHGASKSPTPLGRFPRGGSKSPTPLGRAPRRRTSNNCENASSPPAKGFPVQNLDILEMLDGNTFCVVCGTHGERCDLSWADTSTGTVLCAVCARERVEESDERHIEKKILSLRYSTWSRWPMISMMEGGNCKYMFYIGVKVQKCNIPLLDPIYNNDQGFRSEYSLGFSLETRAEQEIRARYQMHHNNHVGMIVDSFKTGMTPSNSQQNLNRQGNSDGHDARPAGRPVERRRLSLSRNMNSAPNQRGGMDGEMPRAAANSTMPRSGSSSVFSQSSAGKSSQNSYDKSGFQGSKLASLQKSGSVEYFLKINEKEGTSNHRNCSSHSLQRGSNSSSHNLQRGSNYSQGQLPNNAHPRGQNRNYEPNGGRNEGFPIQQVDDSGALRSRRSEELAQLSPGNRGAFAPIGDAPIGANLGYPTQYPRPSQDTSRNEPTKFISSELLEESEDDNFGPGMYQPYEDDTSRRGESNWVASRGA